MDSTIKWIRGGFFGLLAVASATLVFSCAKGVETTPVGIEPSGGSSGSGGSGGSGGSAGSDGGSGGSGGQDPSQTDSDGDGIADANDQCPNFDDNACLPRGNCSTGTCVCNPGRTGPNCDQCLPDHFGLECAMCQCPPGACEDGLNGTGACEGCPDGFVGDDCDICNVGYFGADCQPCTCVNGLCNEGLSGDGQCSECEVGWTGANCDEEDTGPDGDVTITGTVDLSAVNHAGRTCANGGDMVRYSVTALGDDTATLSATPGAGCLNVNDEVLLIQLQGRGSTANVGNYELLRVESVAGSNVTFATAVEQNYGPNVGIGATNARVVLQRVPNYRTFTVNTGATATAAAWSTAAGTGGVFAARADTVVINGTINMNAKGFAGGPTNSAAATAGQQGESIAGPGTKTNDENQGGGGGGVGDPGAPQYCLDNGRSGAGGGHVTAGDTAGATPMVTTCRATATSCSGAHEEQAAGGLAHGSSANPALRVFLGSGGGAGGTDDTLNNDPPGAAGGPGGGIILLFAETLSGNGTITANGGPGLGDTAGFECPCSPNQTSTDECHDFTGAGGGGAGGSVVIEAAEDNFNGTARAAGGPGGNANDDLAGDGGDGGNGRVSM